jgi:hypothetical protein
MKSVLSVSLLSIAGAALLPVSAHAQVLCALGPAQQPYDSMADMPASAAALAEVKKLKSLLCPKGCGKVFLFANATTPNTATVTDGRGASKIAYSPGFVSSAQATYGPIATFGIFAHDLGHHLEATGNKTAWMKESWDGELRADAWAGCAMAKAELTPSRLQAVLLTLSVYPSARHPDWSARRAVITEGYKQCGGRMLPPLAKEKTEKEEGTVATAGPSGCATDKDCRNGRACVSGKCGAPPEGRRCGKDTDCPEPQECGASGHCSGPSSQVRAEEATAKPEAPAKSAEPKAAEPKPAEPMLAALQEPRPATPAPAKDVPACQRSCDQVRDLCVEVATSEGNKCLSAIQSDPSYRSCSCPNYPAGNGDCYRFCATAHERGKSCSTANLVQACRTDGDRCRSQCR